MAKKSEPADQEMEGVKAKGDVRQITNRSDDKQAMRQVVAGGAAEQKKKIDPPSIELSGFGRARGAIAVLLLVVALALVLAYHFLSRRS